MENPDKYYCPSCGELMIYACQTANCEHRVCKCCLDQLFNEDPKTAKCPVSGCQVPLLGEDGIKYFPDRRFQKEIREHCTTKCAVGQCKWVGAVRKLEDHQTECHPSYIVKSVKCSKATHVMVDAKHMDATHSMQHHLEKLTDDVCHTVKVLGEALNTQKHMMDHVIREKVEVKHPNAVPTQSPASMGQPTPQEHCVTQRPFNLMMGEIVPEMDMSTLTQVAIDRDQYLHGQQVQAMKCTADHQQCIGTNTQLQFTALSKLQPITHNNQSVIMDGKNASDFINDQATNLRVSQLPSPKMVNQYTQTVFDNHPPPLPQKTKPSRSVTLPQQGTTLSLNCSPPCSFSVGSDATVTTIESESELRQKELERKSRTMQNILKEELHLNPAKDSSQNEPRKRVTSVPARNLKNIKE